MRVENQQGGRQNTKRMGFPTTVRTVSEDSIVSSPFRQVWTAKNYAKLDSWDDGKRSNSMIGLGRMVPLGKFFRGELLGVSGLLEKMMDQQGKVFLSFPERRHMHRHHIQPIK